MRYLWTALVLVAAAINLAPVIGAFSSERMAAAYGIDLSDPNLQILMRHRAVLFGVVGGLLVAAVLRPRMRGVGYVVGFSSMLSFLLVAWWVGGYGAPIQRVVLLDAVGIAALTGAALVHARWLRAATVSPSGSA